MKNRTFSCLFASLLLSYGLCSPALAAIVPVPGTCGDHACLQWLPSLPTLPGWMPMSISATRPLSMLLPGGATLESAWNVLYGEAIPNPACASLDACIAEQHRSWHAKNPALLIEHVADFQKKNGLHWKLFVTYQLTFTKNLKAFKPSVHPALTEQPGHYMLVAYLWETHETVSALSPPEYDEVSQQHFTFTKPTFSGPATPHVFFLSLVLSSSSRHQMLRYAETFTQLLDGYRP